MPRLPRHIARAHRLYKDHRRGTLWTPHNKLLALLALLYLVCPFDLVPDWIVPILGWLDDLGIIALTALWMHHHRAPHPPKQNPPSSKPAP